MAKTWITVTTAHAPAWLIRLHAAYYRSLGAADTVYFIDRPASYTARELADLARTASLVMCDAAYWDRAGGRPDILTHRQLKNLAAARVSLRADWILHIDTDEFVHLSGGIGALIEGAPHELGEIHFQNVERVIVRGATRWDEGLLRMPSLDRELQLRVYGQRAKLLAAGLANYFHGKSLAANRPSIVQGIHSAMRTAERAELVRMNVQLADGFLVHYACMVPQHFMARLRRNSTLANPNIRRFRHEELLERFAIAHDREGQGMAKAMLLAHFCPPGEASAWIDSGLCRTMPEDYLERLRAAAGSDQRVFDMAYADASFRTFYGPAERTGRTDASDAAIRR